MKIRDTRSLSSSELLDMRMRVVSAVDSGQTMVSVASTFSISRQAVSRWTHMAHRKGESSLLPKKRGRPKGRALRQSHTKTIVGIIVEKLPDMIGLPFYLWTREAICMLIKKKYGIKLSVWTVGRLLKDWGLSPQKPARRAYEKDPIKVKEWLEKEFPAIKELALKEHALILWEDEMGIRSDSQVGRTYGLKGKTPIVPITGKRFSCNMLAGITNKGKLYFMVFQDTFTVAIFLVFIKRLIKQVNRKIFLITDAHPVHRANSTKQYLSKNADKILLFFLPSYSPDLNPSEFLNQDVKANTIRKTRPHDQKEMTTTLRKYLRSRQRKPNVVKMYFHPESVRYAAN